jgi:hypothetical protein
MEAANGVEGKAIHIKYGTLSEFGAAEEYWLAAGEEVGRYKTRTCDLYNSSFPLVVIRSQVKFSRFKVWPNFP